MSTIYLIISLICHFDLIQVLVMYQEGQKRQANETNLDADQSNKKLKTKKRSQNPTSKMHGNDNREFVEAPPQQGRGTLSARTVNGKKVTRAHLELPSSQLLIKEPHTCPSIAKNTTIVENNSAILCHGQDLQTFEVPVATTCPQVVAPSTRKGNIFVGDIVLIIYMKMLTF